MSALGDRRIGAIIDGRYRLLRVIGSGGMGVVYRAEQLLLQKEVAVKLLHRHLRDHPRGAELQQRFLREARSLARLGVRHPHIAPVIDCGVTEDGTLYMAMELLRGEPLCDVIARGPLPPARALHIAVQVLRTLIHAHGHGIVHRDLKPDNIMLTRQDGCEDFVKVLDFGIAKLLSETEIDGPEGEAAGARSAGQGEAAGAGAAAQGEAASARSAPAPAEGLAVQGAEPVAAVGDAASEALDLPGAARPAETAALWSERTGPAPPSSSSPRPQALTRAGVVFGTPEYLAPEQAQGQGVDQRADLYAVGCVLWEMLVGRRPFIGSSALEIISMHLTKAPDPPSQHSPEPLPAGLDEVVLRAMAKRPEERYASAEEFLRALDGVLAEVGRPGPRPTSGRVLTPFIEGIRRAVTTEWRAPASRPAPGSGPVAAATGGGPPRERLWDRAAARLGVRGAALLAGGALLGALLALLALVLEVRAHRQPARPAQAAAPTVGAVEDRPLPKLPLEPLVASLERGQSCEEQRSALLMLIARRDPASLGALERARAQAERSAKLRACLQPHLRDLDEVLENLRAGARGAGIDSPP